ncbi:WD40 repeat-like protein [Ceratobasidium sp. AG-I]|nr:WD40 repeat-like protein [Ceratobasidium sp. AG-I]
MSTQDGTLVESNSILLHQFDPPMNEDFSMTGSPDGTLAACGYRSGTIRIWNARDGTPIGEPLQGHLGMIDKLAFSSDSNRLVSGSSDLTVRIWDARRASPIGQPFRGHEGSVASVALSPDNNLAASGSRDNTVRIWDARDGSLIGEPLRGHNHPVWSVAFSADSNRIASGSYGGTVCIWDARNGTPICEPLQGHDSTVWSVAFSSDGNLVVSGSYDATICIWDVSGGSPVGEPLRGHRGGVFSVAFSPDSHRIVSGSLDHTVRIWDADDGSSIGGPLQGHDDEVRSAYFSADGNHLVSGSVDGTIREWDLRQMLPSFDSVSKRMSAHGMFRCLLRHGCTDLSAIMHSDRYSSSPVARGGRGDVWKGELTNGMVVAIKSVWLHQVPGGDWKGAKRAMRETYVWSQARHQNVQELTGLIMFQGFLGMVSPWMENGNLHKYLEVHPEVERYPLCVQLAAGVAYLHSIDMVHGDLKALNVLVSPEGVLKISDFDYSILSNTTLRFSKTSKNHGGTLRWMAPELLKLVRNEATPTFAPMRNKQTDMYALGMTLLEIVTGRIPYFEFRNDMAVYRAISRKKPPKRPKEMAEGDDRANEMWELLQKCWDHDPAVRPDAPYTLSYHD